MPGFLSKLFRRKKSKSSAPKEASASKKGKKGRKSKGKEKGLLQDVDQATVGPRVGPSPAHKDEGVIRRQGSFSNTSITGRGSNSSREKEAEIQKESLSKRYDQPRVLSPRNRIPDGSSPSMHQHAADKMKFQVVAAHDENNNRDHSNASSAVSPRLSYQQLQQFELQQRGPDVRSPTYGSPSQGHQPMYAMSADLPKQQISAMDDMNRSDASSSSFNLSTDAEDSEYEQLRRRGVLPGHNTSTLDTSTMSQVSLPTTYTTDDDRIFPALQTDDDMTQATAPSVKEPSVNQPERLLVPLHTPDDEPGRIQIFPMNNETEDDLRAWNLSPSTQASKDLASAKSASSHQVFTFQGAGSMQDTGTGRTSKTPTSMPPTSTTSSRNTPGAHRNFTSPKSQASTGTDFSNNDFANFADFSNFPSTTGMKPWGAEERSDPKPSQSPRDAGKEFEASFNITPTNHSSAASATQQDSSLSELLAQAKNKRKSGRSSRTGRPAASSVNSAPAITASYLRQHHNLQRYSTGTGAYGDRERESSRSNSNEGTSVSDIISSLEATNQSRIKTGGRNVYAHRSVGDTGATSTARAAKERLRDKRRREREYNASTGLHKSRSSEVSSSDNSENEASESWLFDEVTGALGPRGIAADLESLSGRSNRSKNSQGNKSHKSHRSRSHRSRRSSQRRGPKSSNESVDSRGSRHSRNSRYSHRSTKSFLSQMSEQSRSVANDLLRLEMQLAMVGSQENRDDVPVRGSGSVGGASIGGASRTSRTSRKSLTSHRTHSSSIARRSKVTVVAPPGKLGIILANKADSKGTVVSGVRTSSVLAEKISPGDRIVAIDGEDVSRMTVSEITTIMSRKSDYERTLTILTTPKHLSMGPESMPHRSPVKASPDQFDNSFQQYRR
jgi:hypothetical protein